MSDQTDYTNGSAQTLPLIMLDAAVVFPYTVVTVPLDDVDTPALPVMRPQDGRVGVGETPQILRFLGQDEAAERVQILAHGSRERLGDLDQQGIAAP